LEQHSVELLQHKLFVRSANGALAFEQHEDMIIVIMVVHVVLKASFAIDHPKIRKISSPHTQVIDARIRVGFLNGIFHLDHGVSPLF
jgi:hypothetical protein